MLDPVVVPITFAAASGERVHSPLVTAGIGDRSTLIVLDTGSDTHLVTAPLAEALRLVEGKIEAGTDHGGTELSSWQVGDVDVVLAGTTLTLRDVVSIPEPPPFGGWGIGGIVSPQRLMDDGCVIVDTIRDELVLARATEAVADDWVRKRRPDCEEIRLRPEPGFGPLVVRAAIRPFPETHVLINTGGVATEFSPGALPGLAVGAARSLGRGVSGDLVTGGSAGRQILEAGGRAVVIEDLAIRDGMREVEGMVGMDTLRGTVVGCWADPRRDVRWLVPRSRFID